MSERRASINEPGGNERVKRRSSNLSPGQRLSARRDANDTSAVGNLYVLRTYGVRIHESKDVSKYTLGSEWSLGFVVKIENNNVWFGKDETFYVTSEVPKKLWYPDAMHGRNKMPLFIDHIYKPTKIYVMGLSRTFLFSPLESRGYTLTNLSDMTPEMNAALRGFVEGEMNKFFLRTLPKYNKTEEEMADIEKMQREITEYNDQYFADEAKQGVDVTSAPKKAKHQSGYFWDSGPFSPSYREKPRPGKGPIRGSVSQLRYGKRATVCAPRRLNFDMESESNSKPRKIRAKRGGKLSRKSRSPMYDRRRSRSSIVGMVRKMNSLSMAKGECLEVPSMEVPSKPKRKSNRLRL